VIAAAGAGGMLVAQRYELAAELCRGLRVLDLSDAPAAARVPLEASAGELVLAGGEEQPTAASFDAVVMLDGRAGERRDGLLAELESHAAAGARLLAAFERGGGHATSPRATPSAEDAAREFAGRIRGSVVLPQFIAEGSLIGSPDGNGSPALELRGADAREEDAAALIVAAGFAEGALAGARANLRLAATPVLLSYVRGLEASQAELLRANRELARERIGRDGSAAASLLNAQRELEHMRTIAREHEEQVHRVHAWYDAPRYHLVDRVRTTLIRMPGIPGLIRLLWSLISTRAETPQLDAAANPEPDEDAEDAATVTREREGISKEDAKEPADASSRLEQ
jgi:hypothetical protein